MQFSFSVQENVFNFKFMAILPMQMQLIFFKPLPLPMPSGNTSFKLMYALILANLSKSTLLCYHHTTHLQILFSHLLILSPQAELLQFYFFFLPVAQSPIQSTKKAFSSVLVFRFWGFSCISTKVAKCVCGSCKDEWFSPCSFKSNHRNLLP